MCNLFFYLLLLDVRIVREEKERKCLHYRAREKKRGQRIVILKQKKHRRSMREEEGKRQIIGSIGKYYIVRDIDDDDMRICISSSPLFFSLPL